MKKLIKKRIIGRIAALTLSCGLIMSSAMAQYSFVSFAMEETSELNESNNENIGNRDDVSSNTTNEEGSASSDSESENQVENKNVSNSDDDIADANAAETDSENDSSAEAVEDTTNYVEVSTEDEFREALSAGKCVKLTNDISLTKGYIVIKNETSDVDVNLGGKTITVEQTTASFAIKEGTNIRFTNGTVTGNQSGDDSGAAFECGKGSKVALENMSVTGLIKAVDVQEAALKISDCTFENNRSKSKGGAISLNKSEFEAEGKNTFIGNSSDDQGGAISFDNMTSKTITLANMIFKNNSSNSSNWGNGGGAVYMFGDTDLVVDTSSTFDGNFANGSGGAILFSGNSMQINGIYTNNTAMTHEGGAIAIVGNFRKQSNSAALVSGQFTGNKTGYDREGNANENYQDWGGGAIFVSDASSLTVPARTVITDNSAGGFGGGLAGCSTGRVFVFGDENSSAILFNNKGGLADEIHVSGSGSEKHDDHQYAAENETFMNSGYDDFFSALNSVVSREVFGDSSVSGSVDHKVISDDDVLYVASYVTGISASLDDIRAAEDALNNARVIITGNKSYTHGGGILCNGYIVVGDPSTQKLSVGKSLELRATKDLLGIDDKKESLEGHDYTFSLKDELGNTLITGKSDENGKINFDGKLSFDRSNFTEGGSYTYYLSEDELPDGDNVDGVPVVRDSTKYKIVVSVSKNATKQFIGGLDFDTDKYEISGISVYRVSTDGAEELIESRFVSNDEAHAGVLDMTGNSATFTNRVKTVPDEPDEPTEPETPEEPDEPETPDTPDTPQNPDTPTDPSEPETPGETYTVTPNVDEPALPEVLGAVRERADNTAELPQVLGARRARTSDAGVGTNVLIIAAAMAVALITLRRLKKD